MKVNIKPPSPSITIRDIVDFLFFFSKESKFNENTINILTYGCSIEDEDKTVIRPLFSDKKRELTFLAKIFVKINSLISVFYKDKIIIEKHDTWSADISMAMIISPLLKKLKENKQGAPHVEDMDVPDNIRSTNDGRDLDEYDIDKFHFDRWDYVLDEMIFAMDSKLDDWSSQFFTGNSDYLLKPIDKGDQIDGYQLIEGENHTRVYDKDGYKKYQDRISNGFRLFGKYYEGLWS